MKTKTADLLLEHLNAWEKKEGERKTLKEFADLIGISDKVFNHVFTGKREPTEEQTQLFAMVFQDHRFYDVTDRVPSDEERIFVNYQWSKLDTKEKKRIADEVAQYITKGEG